MSRSHLGGRVGPGHEIVDPALEMTGAEALQNIGQIPHRANRKQQHAFSPTPYRERNRVERFFNRLKQCRRIATRYEKLATKYLAMIKLAAVRLWLRATMPNNESAA